MAPGQQARNEEIYPNGAGTGYAQGTTAGTFNVVGAIRGATITRVVSTHRLGRKNAPIPLANWSELRKAGKQTVSASINAATAIAGYYGDASNVFDGLAACGGLVGGLPRSSGWLFCRAWWHKVKPRAG